MSTEAENPSFAIIGCGVIGSTHADALAAVPGSRLIAVAGIGGDQGEGAGDGTACPITTTRHGCWTRSVPT